MFISFKPAHIEKVHHQEKHRQHVEHVDRQKDPKIDEPKLWFVLVWVECFWSLGLEFRGMCVVCACSIWVP